VTRGPACGLGTVVPVAHWRSRPTACAACPLARRAARECAPKRSPCFRRPSRHGRQRHYRGRGGVLEHPRWRGHPSDDWVKAATHLSFLAMGRGGKTGMAAAFSDKVGASVAGRVLRRGGKEEGAQAQLYLEKKAARGGCSGLRSPWSGSRRRRRSKLRQ
jgi:hypothetical protein